ncbi:MULTISPECIES: hypothetical protein [unclassified Mesorhizobium]|uniref:hypothetical protein n=1 Tax=unclassified Mesorhizobium TaxID=325217 RepID=UPI00112A8D4D|nr:MULTISPECIES: hypothetical protein [unclassified Mesorhizobium]TPI21021.1 hypothetical protein FJW10_09770 [Mesorhizobium sp. B4-1-1]TPL54353.1 hypothetical protein FJ957_03025 [Mesorhizobium sp. B2-4-6]
MSKPIDTWHGAYDPQTFADKHGLTLAQAKIVISSNGPSKHGCDMGAVAFLNALKMRETRKPARRRPNSVS